MPRTRSGPAWALCELQADFCKSISHPTRIRILDALNGRERTVGELQRLIGITQTNLSQHLAILRERGAVLTRRQGQRIWYRISDPRLLEACHLLRATLRTVLKARQPPRR